jgi:hypothetical protein
MAGTMLTGPNASVMTPLQVPAPPAPPATPSTPQIVVDGRPITSPAEVYQAYQAQRRELTRQLSSLEDQRRTIANRLRESDVQGVDRAGLEARVTQLDARITQLSQEVATADANVARAAGVPGAVVTPRPAQDQGPPEEVIALGALFMLVFVLPLSIAWARRIWRRAEPRAESPVEHDLADRFTRLEQAMDAVAIEVERIGEGQRYMAQRLGPGAAEAIPLAQREAVRR